MISGLFNTNLLFKLIERIVLNQSDNQYKSLVIDVAKQECLAQPFIDNSNAKTQSTDSEGVILQGVQRDNGNALPSSGVSCTNLEACEEYTQTKSWKEGSPEKCDKSVSSAMKANTIKSISKTTKKLIQLVSALQKCDENSDDVSSTLTVEMEDVSHFQDT